MGIGVGVVPGTTADTISVTLDPDLRRDLDVPGILIPLPADPGGGGTIDLSRIRFADPSAFGRRLGRVTATMLTSVDAGLRRLLAL